jgi:MFS family permease
VVTAYMLAQGAVIPMTGWATDRFGTKRLYLLTIVLFTVASMACGLAQNLPQLIFFRVIQGIGGGMLMPIGMTIILKAVGPTQMGRVMGIFGVPMLLAPALGPVLGGWFVQDFTWRLIFYVNVPIGIVGLFAASRYLRETGTTHKLRLDAFGLLTATPAVVALMYAVDQSTSLGWSSSLVISLLAMSVMLAASFIVSQLGRRRTAILLLFPVLILGLAVGVDVDRLAVDVRCCASGTHLRSTRHARYQRTAAAPAPLQRWHVLVGDGAELHHRHGDVRRDAAHPAVPAGGARLQRVGDRSHAASSSRDRRHRNAGGRNAE